MPNRLARSSASVLECSEENRDGIETPRTESGPRASAAMTAVSAESMPPDSPITTCVKPVLSHVVPQTQLDRPVDLLLGAQQGTDLVPAGGCVEVEVDEEAILFELRRPMDHFAVRRQDHRVAVEHQLVLAADHVQIHDRHPGGPSPLAEHLLPVRSPCRGDRATR